MFRWYPSSVAHSCYSSTQPFGVFWWPGPPGWYLAVEVSSRYPHRTWTKGNSLKVCRFIRWFTIPVLKFCGDEMRRTRKVKVVMDSRTRRERESLREEESQKSASTIIRIRKSMDVKSNQAGSKVETIASPQKFIKIVVSIFCIYITEFS